MEGFVIFILIIVIVNIAMKAAKVAKAANKTIGKMIPPPASKHHFPPRPKPPAAPPPESPRTQEQWIRHWIDVIRVGEPAGTYEAEQRLVAIGPAAAEQLADASYDSAPHVREVARRVLQRVAGAPRVAEPAHKPEREPDIVVESSEPEPPRVQQSHDSRDLIDTTWESWETSHEDMLPTPIKYEPPAIPDLPPPPVVTWSTPEAPNPIVPDAPPPPPVLPPVETSAEGDAALLTDLVFVAATSRLDDERKMRIEGLAGRNARFALIVGQVTWTGAFDAGDDYRSGRTVSGKIKDTDVEIGVRLPKSQNELADTWKQDDEIAVVAVFVGWDGIYDRGTFEGRAGPNP